ncbi:uncharacterized protein LOC119878084 isoform X1 [Canis lupus familiaris]|uniref:uncharacterized protein LOC119878084 isoform X1 n=1 Tax=Canis lupus familiaris TaxID=9615 RepID=UPI0018F390A9|nr:uncharacterized protein LOC119878084 isoform X1 [Canis lupus familiaris]
MAGDRLHRNSTNGPFPSSSKEKKKKNDLSAADLLPHVGQRRGSSKEKFCSRDLTGLSLQGASVCSGPQAQDHSENLLWMGLDWSRRTQVYCYLVHRDGQAWPQGEPGKTPVPQLLCHWLLLVPTL